MSKLLLAVLVGTIQLSEPLAAGEATTIRQIVESGNFYHLRSANLKGTVRNLQAGLPSFWGDGSHCSQYDSYAFTLDDSTGLIEVMVRGICGRPNAVVTVSEGDKVIVQAMIYAYLKDGGGSLVIQAMAQKVVHVDP